MGRLQVFAVALLALGGGCGSGGAGAGDDDGAGDDAGAGDGGAGGPDAPGSGSADAATLPPPTWSSELVLADAPSFETRRESDGVVELGRADAAAGDGRVARVTFHGAPSLTAADRVGAGFASEIATRRFFGYGTYRVRASLAGCAAGEDAVNGLFTYFNDGTDHDGDGMIDNAEIDLEILCGTPDVVFLTVWTEYSAATGVFRRWSRAIDFARGDVWEAPSDREFGLDMVGHDATLVLPTLLDPGRFVELGFEWRADRVRFFATIDGAERTLATLTDAARIPRLPGAFMANVWHPDDHWFGGGPVADHPAADVTLLVDWIRYWE